MIELMRSITNTVSGPDNRDNEMYVLYPVSVPDSLNRSQTHHTSYLNFTRTGLSLFVNLLTILLIHSL